MAHKNDTVEVNRKIKERILLVDDDETLVDISLRILRRLGYHAVGACSGEEALEIFIKQPDAFDLIITDTAMPGMDGLNLSSRLTGIRPEVPIIVCSGFNPEIPAEEAKRIGIRAYLNKPFVTEEMEITIRRVLDGC